MNNNVVDNRNNVPLNPIIPNGVERNWYLLLRSWGLNDATIIKIVSQGITSVEILTMYGPEFVTEAVANIGRFKLNPLVAANPDDAVDIPVVAKLNLQIVQYGAKFWFRAERKILTQDITMRF